MHDVDPIPFWDEDGQPMNFPDGGATAGPRGAPPPPRYASALDALREVFGY